jgi:hypothetical protein
MTAAEILQNALPPSDDGIIEKALADLDAKMWEWTDALKSAQTQLRNAFALRPVPVAAPAPPPTRPSARLYDDGPMPSLAASAAAAHIPSLPPLPEWMTTTTKPDASAWAATPPPPSAPSRPQQQSSAFQNLPSSNEWPQPSQQHAAPPAQDSGAGTMQWPTTPSGGNWPTENPSASTGPQQWPTWSPTDSSGGSSTPSAKKSSVRATKAPKAVRPIVEGPTPEERAHKAATEEVLLSELEETIARRVRLLRRLDPDTPIERLIDKAKQGQAEAQASAPPKEDKSSSSSSSWWRRK